MANDRMMVTKVKIDRIGDALRERRAESVSYTLDEMPEAIRSIPSGGGDIDVEPLSITQNGTYTAPSGKAYSPVEVNVSEVSNNGLMFFTTNVIIGE